MTSCKMAAGSGFLSRSFRPAEIFSFEECSGAQRMIYAAAQEFLRREILPVMARIESRQEGLLPALIGKAGARGLIGVSLPERHGGAGFDEIAACLVADALGGAASFSVAHSGQAGIGLLPLLYFGSAQQKHRFLPRIVSGAAMAAYCLTEAGAGSDALNCRTTAEPQPGGGFRLHGEKLFVSNGAWAELFIVFAGVRGKLSAFIVERASPGLTIGPEERKIGLHGSSTTPVHFDGCPVPAENMLLGAGYGHRIAFSILHIARARLAAAATGAGKMAVAEAVRHAVQREQFGKPIARFGLIQAKLAGMAVRTYLSESIVYRLAAAMAGCLAQLADPVADDGEQVAAAIGEYALECAAAKVFGSEGLDYCVDELVQIHGAYGYTGHGAAQRMYRDSRVNRIFEGTSEINRLLVAATLFKRAGRGRLSLVTDEASLLRVLDGLPGPPEQEAAVTLEICRQLILLAGGAMADGGAGGAADEQELAGWLADMVIETYAAESGLLRALKGAGMELPLAAANLFLRDALTRMLTRARRIVLRADGDPARREGRLLLLGRIAAAPLFRTDGVPLMRAIAGKAIAGRRYPFN